MASDDDDRRRQNAAEDERRRQNAEDERRRQQNAEDERRRWQKAQDDKRREDAEADRLRDARLEAERKRKFDEAMRKGDHGTALRELGVPPTLGSSGNPDRTRGVEPARAPPPAPGFEFQGHKRALLQSLQSAPGLVLPPQLVANWTARVERLDIERPEAGLAEIKAIAGEYQQARSQYESSVTQLTRPLQVDDEVESIGRKIEQLGWLLSNALHSM